MSNIEEFLTEKEERDIVEAIRKAEQQTSGEIRVHIESTAQIDTIDRAMDVFHELKMDNTKLQNGVLIYLAIDDRNFVIYGDKGINDVVESDFWDCTKDTMLSHFKKGDFKQGLVEGIARAGEQLAKHFPWHHTDTNELPNDISKG